MNVTARVRLCGAVLALLALGALGSGLAAQEAVPMWGGPGSTIGLAGGLKVHLAQGMWSQHWRLEEALVGQCEITTSFLCSRYGFVTSLKGFPLKIEDLLAERVLVLANVPPDAFAREGSWQSMRDVAGRSADWVEQFVAQGGGLFVLGGNYALGAWGNPVDNTAFFKCLPADIHKDDIPFASQNKPVELTPVGTHPILAGLNWDQKPVTLFYHEVALRPEAQVLVKAGEAPVLIAGTYGKGRVVLLAATLHGEPAAPAVAYWHWDGWPALVRNVTQWLAGAG